MSTAATKHRNLTDAEAVAAFESGDFATGEIRDHTATDDIRAAVAARSRSDDMVTQAVAKARERGLTRVEIAPALGISAQGARQRYGTQ